MNRLAEVVRWVLGPAERRALHRAARWGVGTFLVAYALFEPVCGPYPGALTAGIYGWFGFVAGLIAGLAGHRRVSG